MTLNSLYTDHEGYALDASWGGDLAFDDASSFTGTNNDDGVGTDNSSVSFTTSEPNSGDGSTYTFDVTVSDDRWLTNNSNGLNTINTSVTVKVLPEPNQDPTSDVTVPAAQEDHEGGAYWLSLIHI